VCRAENSFLKTQMQKLNTGCAKGGEVKKGFEFFESLKSLGIYLQEHKREKPANYFKY